MSTQPQAKQNIVKTDKDRFQDVFKVLETRKSEIQRALPQHMRQQTERMIRIALSTVHNGGLLLQCDPTTVYYSVLFACQQGLSLDPILGHGYLIPFYNRNLYGKDKGGYECKFLPGYRGLIELAMRSQKVIAVRANVVFVDDEFDYEEGLTPRLIHKPNPASKRRGMEDAIAAYDVVQLRGVPREENPFHIMWKDDIHRIRERSKGAWRDNKDTGKRDLVGPWATDWMEMWKKTPVRQHSKYLQLSPDLTQMAVYDEYADRGLAKMVYDPEAGRVDVQYDQEGEENGGQTQTRGPVIDAEPRRQPVEAKTETKPDVQKDVKVDVKTSETGQQSGQTVSPSEAPETEWGDLPGAQEKPEAKPVQQTREPEVSNEPAPPPGSISKSQATRLRAIWNAASKKGEAAGEKPKPIEILYEYLKKNFQIEHLSHIAKTNYDEICRWAGGDSLKLG